MAASITSATEITSAESLITSNLDIWTSAIKQKASTGRGSNKKQELYGIKKLRELILELAVRGLLVPQDPNDEPASVLLEKIAEEKERLIKEGKLKKQKPLPEISIDERPFDLPGGWEFLRLGDICALNGGYAFKSSNYTEEGARVVRISDFDERGFKNERIVRHEYTDELEQYVLKENNILMAMTGGTVGKCFLVQNVDEKMVVNQRVATMRFFSEVLPRYIKSALQTSVVQKVIEEAKNSTNDNISMSNIKSFIIATPPEREVDRICTKVNELMALCDQLEQQTESSLTAHQTLVETLLNSLLEAAKVYPGHASSAAVSCIDAKTDPFQMAWQQIWDNFELLFTTEHSIDQLKQTILQLAVMGKLVPQDPEDEPASVLLEKITAEKEQLIKEKKIKKQKELPPIGDDEKPFELPVGWEWCRFDDVVDIQSGITKGKNLKGRDTIVVPYLSVANVQRSYLDLSHVKEVEIPVEDKKKYEVADGDLLITEGGDWDKVGRTAIWRDESAYMAHQNHVFKARPFLSSQSEAWLETYLNSPFSRDYFAGSSKQTTNLASINKTQLRGCLIAVPPTTEKNCIITKVGELAVLCDSLKECIAESQTTQLNFTDAIAEQVI